MKNHRVNGKSGGVSNCARLFQINSVEQLFKVQSQLTRNRKNWIFRGQKSATWSLSTRLERSIREFDLDMKNAAGIEAFLLKEFRRQCQNYITRVPEETHYGEWLALMQHHGAPTRLLDWTQSFYVACYFAVEETNGKCAVWALDSGKLIQRIKKILPPDMIGFLEKYDDSKVSKSFKRLFLGSTSKTLVFPACPYSKNQRLVVQQGLFLIPGDITESFGKNLSACFTDAQLMTSLRKYEIEDNPDLRKEIIEQLHRMKVNRSTLFPNLDGFAQSLRMRLAFSEIEVDFPDGPDYFRRIIAPN